MDASQALSNCCIKLQMSYFVQKFFPGPAFSVRNVCLALCCSPGPVPVVSPKISTRQGYLRGTCALEASNTLFRLKSTCLIFGLLFNTGCGKVGLQLYGKFILVLLSILSTYFCSSVLKPG